MFEYDFAPLVFMLPLHSNIYIFPINPKSRMIKKESVIKVLSVIALILAVIIFFQEFDLHYDLKLMLLLPILSFLIVFARIIVGMKTFGTFGPLILGVAFFHLGILKALMFYSIILLFGLFFHMLLRHLDILSVPQTSLTISAITLTIISGYVIYGNLGILNTLILPFLITSHIIESMSDEVISKGYSEAFIMLIQTLLIAIIGAALAGYIAKLEGNIILSILFLTVSLNFALSLYTGARLAEIFRFRKLIK